MRLAIDFDDTIHDTGNVAAGYKMGKPMPGAVASIIRLKEQGHRVIVHSVGASGSAQVVAIKQWLHYFGIPYDDVTNIKPNADVYLDDKALHFTSWEQAMEDLNV